jgi:hypothetical protein
VDHDLESLEVGEMSSSLSLSDLLGPAGLGPLLESRRSLDLSLDGLGLHASLDTLDNVGGKGDMLEVGNLSGNAGGGAVDEDLGLVLVSNNMIRVLHR